MPRAPILAALVLPAVLLAGCGEPITPDPSDSTPPHAHLGVVGLGANVDVNATTGPVTRTVTLTDSMLLVGSGKDTDGGVENVIINLYDRVTCVDGDIGQLRHAHGYVENPDETANTTSESASTKRFVVHVIDMSDYRCSGSFQLQSIHGEVSVTSRNFAGQTTTTPLFTFNYP